MTQGQMPKSTPVVAVKASGPGALDGYESTCECGLVMRSSLRTMADADRQQHARWHAEAGR